MTAEIIDSLHGAEAVRYQSLSEGGPTLCGFRVDVEIDGFSTSFGDDEFVPREGRTPFRIGSQSLSSVLPREVDDRLLSGGSSSLFIVSLPG